MPRPPVRPWPPPPPAHVISSWIMPAAGVDFFQDRPIDASCTPHSFFVQDACGAAVRSVHEHLHVPGSTYHLRFRKTCLVSTLAAPSSFKMPWSCRLLSESIQNPGWSHNATQWATLQDDPALDRQMHSCGASLGCCWCAMATPTVDRAPAQSKFNSRHCQTMPNVLCRGQSRGLRRGSQTPLYSLRLTSVG